MKNKIIFLDVDGVLNRAWFQEGVWDDYCLRQLKLLVKNTGAKIVVSSSWGECQQGLDAMREKLTEFGLEIFDNLYQTPDGTFLYQIKASQPRETLIPKWLAEHEHGNWVVLDDWDLHKEFPNHMVRTWDYHRAGLDEAYRRDAEKILNAEPPAEPV